MSRSKLLQAVSHSSDDVSPLLSLKSFVLGRHWAALGTGVPQNGYCDTGQNREPECHRFRDTGLALESSASRKLGTGRTWGTECRPKAYKMPPFCS